MTIAFDGASRRITLSAGTTVLGVRDLWSRWVDWAAQADNSKYLPAFEQVGGNTIDPGAGTSIPIYAFLVNGWKIKPQESSHTLNVNDGVLLVEGGGDPFLDTAGSFVVRVNYQQPVQAVTVATGGGGGLSAEQAARLLEVWQRLGLDPANPVSQSSSQIGWGAIVLALAEAAGTVIVSRQP